MPKLKGERRNMMRKNTVTVPMSEGERAAIDRWAADSGMSLSAYIRYVLFTACPNAIKRGEL